MNYHREQFGLRDIFKEQTGFSREQLTAIALHLMDKSFEASAGSDHDIYKVGGAIHSIVNGREVIESGANTIPLFLKEYGVQKFIDETGVHPTQHSEFQLYLKAPASKYLFGGCNTCSCANCMKAAVMRGVDALFIPSSALPGRTDKHGKVNEWARDREYLWTDLSLEIARNARIPVYAVDMDNRTIEDTPIVNGVPFKHRPAIAPLPPHHQPPARVLEESEITDLYNNPDLFLSNARGVRAVIAVAHHKTTEKKYCIYAEDCYPPGFTALEGKLMAEKFANQKHRFPLDPMIHMMMLAARQDLRLENGQIFANFMPSADRMVELAAAGFTGIKFSDPDMPITDQARQTMRILKQAKQSEYTFVKPNEAISRLIEQVKSDNLPTNSPK